MIEYVASGCSFLRITYKQCMLKENIELINSFFSEMNGKNDHEFSLLFNAFTEAQYGKYFDNYKDSLYKVHADSGGLQIITQGKTVTPEIKQQIYKTQSTYAHVGMSFDDIPLITTGKSKRNDLSTRFFDRQNFDKYARNTGIDLAEQIKAFQDHKTSCEPFFIVHGNDIGTAMRWVEVAMEQVPDELKPFIGGVAMGGGSFGNGQKEALLRAFLAGNIIRTRDDIVHKRIHFLGLGSLNNAFPFLSMMKSGWYDPSWHISYDSTTHTSAHHMGDYFYNDGSRIAFGKHLTHDYTLIHEDIKANLKTYEVSGYTPELLHKTLTSPAQGYVDQGGRFADVLYSNLGCALSSMANFTRKIDTYSKDFQLFLEERVPVKEWNLYQQVAKIKSVDDYKYWDRHMGKMIPSMRLGDYTNTNLDDFFD